MSGTETKQTRFLQGKQGVYCLTLTVGIVLYSIITPISYTVLPSIVKDLHGDAYYAWVAAVFALGSFIGACLLGTALRFMRAHIAYSVSLLLFACCTLACAYAASLPFLLFARMIQGLSGGLLVALTYNMLNTALPPPLLPRGIGLISGMWGLGTIMGPYIGGSFENWRIPFFAVSFVTLIFCGFICIGFKKFTNDSLPQKQHNPAPIPFLPICILTALVIIIGLGGAAEFLQRLADSIAHLFNIESFAKITPFSAHISALLLSFLLLMLLAFTEKHSSNRLFPAQTFSVGSFFFIIYTVIILNMVALGATKLYLPFFLQNLHHAGKISAGYIAFTDSIGWSLGALIGAALNTSLSGNQTQKNGRLSFYQNCVFGRRFVFIFAPLFCVIGMAVMFLLIPVPSDSVFTLLAIAAAFFATGVFSGIFWPHILAKIMQKAADGEKEAADSSVVTVQLFAAALADCVAGTVVNATNFRTEDSASVSYAASILFGFCLCLLITVFLLFFKINSKEANRKAASDNTDTACANR